MDQTSVRYIVDDLDEAIDFYSANLDFEEVMRAGSGFAMLRRRSLRLLLNVPGGGGGAGEAMPDGINPSPAAGTVSSWRSTTSTLPLPASGRPD